MHVFYKFWIITWRSISYFLNKLNHLKETDITSHHQDHTILVFLDRKLCYVEIPRLNKDEDRSLCNVLVVNLLLNAEMKFRFSLQPLDTASSKMQTCEFGKSKGLWKSLSESTWSESFDGLGISLLLTANPSIQVWWLDIEYVAGTMVKQKILIG